MLIILNNFTYSLGLYICSLYLWQIVIVPEVFYILKLPTTRTFKSRLSQSLSSLFPSVFALYIHTSTKFTTLDHIQVCFPHIFNPTHSPHILEQSQSALSTAQTPHILSDSTSLLVPQVIFDI